MKKYPLTVNDLVIEAEFDEKNVATIFYPLLKKWSELQKAKGQRIFVFLAAPPGCGKTTLALFLEQLSKTMPDFTPIQAIGLDGFHYEQAYLDSHTIDMDGQAVSMKNSKGIRQPLTCRCCWKSFKKPKSKTTNGRFTAASFTMLSLIRFSLRKRSFCWRETIYCWTPPPGINCSNTVRIECFCIPMPIFWRSA